MAEKLISAVSEYPELYNRTLPAYRDPGRKTETWKAVSERLGLKEGDCRKKWRNLRDIFTRKVKADRCRGAKGNALKDWRFSQPMSFLIPFTHSSRSGTSNNSAEELDDMKEEGAETTSNSDVQNDLDRSLSEAKMSPTPLVNSFQEISWKDSWQIAGQLGGEKEDEMFFMSLLPHLKRLPYQKKCLIKLKFHQLLHQAEFE